MDTWTEALMTMMNTADGLLLHSDVKKEEDAIGHDGCLQADSSLYSPTTARLEFQIELSQTNIIAPGSCESYETTPTSVVGSSSSSTEMDDSEKQHCSSTTTADVNNSGRFRGRIQDDFSDSKAISTICAALYQSSPRSISSPEPDPEQAYCSSTTSLLGGYDQIGTRGEYKDDNGPKRVCLVCGDIASGFHYGVASCEACKAFFKRTIQGNIEYTCPAANDCEINKRRRKACQACRFRKCIMMGMLKEGVRLDRVRGGRQKYRRVIPYAVNSPAKQSEGRGHLLRLLLQSDVECSPSAAVTQRSVPTNMDSVTRTLCILSDMYDRDLVSTIGWAKQIPVFTELPLNDQMRLLQNTWPEILTLSLAYRSRPLGSGSSKLKWAPDFTLDSTEAAECSMTEFYEQSLQIGRRLEQLSVTREEYVLLKALVLANSDISIENRAPLQRLKSSLLSELADYVNTRQDVTDTRLYHLLLCLPCVRQIDPIIRDFWTALRLEMPQIPMNKLFLEMLETPCR